MYLINRIKLIGLFFLVCGSISANADDVGLKQLNKYLIHGFDTSINIENILLNKQSEIKNQNVKIQLEFYKISSILLLDIFSQESETYAQLGLDLAIKTKNLSKVLIFKVILSNINTSKNNPISQRKIEEYIKDVDKLEPSNDKIVSFLYISRICRELEIFYLQLKAIHLGIDTSKFLDVNDLINLRLKGDLYNQLGLYYMSIKDYEKSEIQLKLALQIFESIDNSIRASITIFNIGISLQENNKHQKAIEFFNKTIEVKQLMNENYGLGLGHMYLSHSLLFLNKNHLSEKHIDRAIDLLEEMKSNDRLAYTYLFKAQTSSALGKQQEAIKFIKLSLSHSNEFYNQEKQTIVFDRIFQLLKKIDDNNIKNEFLEQYFTQQNTLMKNHIDGVLEKAVAEYKLVMSNNKNTFLLKLDTLNKESLLIQERANKVKKQWIFGLFILSLVLFYSILRQIKISKDYKQQSLVDSLTGLLNRRAYFKKLDNVYSNPIQKNKSAYLLLFDIDKFKNINDTYGHLGGDEVLINLSNLLKRFNTANDFVARIGGEEFAIVHFSNNSKSAINYCENLINQIFSLTTTYNNKEIKISISLGVSKITLLEELENIINKTDKLMYLAKDNGRNRYEKSFV